MYSAEAKAERYKKLRRPKREWILPPKNLEENKDYTQKEYIALVLKKHPHYQLFFF